VHSLDGPVSYAHDWGTHEPYSWTTAIFLLTSRCERRAGPLSNRRQDGACHRCGRVEHVTMRRRHPARQVGGSVKAAATPASAAENSLLTVAYLHICTKLTAQASFCLPRDRTGHTLTMAGQNCIMFGGMTQASASFEQPPGTLSSNSPFPPRFVQSSSQLQIHSY